MRKSNLDELPNKEKCIMAKMTEKEKRLKREQKERREKNKLERNTAIDTKGKAKVDVSDVGENAFDDSLQIQPNIEWLDLEYAGKKRYNFYLDFVKNFEKKGCFSRDLDFENYNFILDLHSDELRDYVVEYNGDDKFLREIAPCIEHYRCRRYRDAYIALVELLDRYPDEGWIYYYCGRAFSYAYMSGNGEFYSLRFFKRAVELNGYIEMYLEYANMVMVCGNILVRSDMKNEAEKMYKLALQIYDEAEKKYPECGDISRMREYVPSPSNKHGKDVERFTKQFHTFDNECREWKTENLLFPIEEDLLIK